MYGDAAVAGISIATRIVSFLFCVALGIGQGFQPVSAFNYGAKIYSRVKKGFYFTLKSGTALMAILAVIAFTFSGQFVALFRDDPDVNCSWYNGITFPMRLFSINADDDVWKYVIFKSIFT